MRTHRLILPALTALAPLAAQVAFPGPDPGPARLVQRAGTIRLENQVLAVIWKVSPEGIQPLQLLDKLTGKALDQSGCSLFRLATMPQDPKAPLTAFNLDAAKDFRLASPLKPRPLKADPRGVRLADRVAGKALEATFEGPNGLQVLWRAELRDGSSYVRQTFTVGSKGPSTPLTGVDLAETRIPGTSPAGTSAGSPVAGGGWFQGLEMPGYQPRIDGAMVHLGLACRLEARPDARHAFSTVAGVFPQDQLRRTFLAYLERERARPSSPFLHYNCWYDLGYNLTADAMVDVARAFHQELAQRRGVKVQSYLLDDGWDDFAKDLWRENPATFPGGFKALKAKMDPMGAKLSLWISPLGGYGGDKERTAHAVRMGLIPAGSSLDLSQPRYKAWFQARCLEVMKEGGVNAFKWDKAGEGVTPHFMALMDIARNLRQKDPNLFINVTVGTWPSPFWLNHIDTTWRTGEADVSWAGVGDKREQWLTFRDGACRKRFVVPAPLYPLNSVMHHGIVHGREFQGKDVSIAGADLKHEARSYFGSGAMLQELYLTPSMMTAEAWDQVAEAARWAEKHKGVLVDSHWVGGDPLKLEPYGYAAWSPKGAVLTLRNPSDWPTTLTLDAQTAFELPKGAAGTFQLKAAYPDQRMRTLDLQAGRPVQVTLEPFEVLVFEGTAKQP